MNSTTVYDQRRDEWRAECTTCGYIAQAWRSLALAQYDAKVHTCKAWVEATT